MCQGLSDHNQCSFEKIQKGSSCKLHSQHTPSSLTDKSVAGGWLDFAWPAQHAWAPGQSSQCPSKQSHTSAIHRPQRSKAAGLITNNLPSLPDAGACVSHDHPRALLHMRQGWRMLRGMNFEGLLLLGLGCSWVFLSLQISRLPAHASSRQPGWLQYISAACGSPESAFAAPPLTAMILLTFAAAAAGLCCPTCLAHGSPLHACR